MDAPDLAQIAADEMRANGLEPVFAPEVLREAEHLAQDGAARSGDIRDLRGRPWFSIDNDDTLDLDQLTWAEALPDGSVRLAVAVADVDALVRRGGSVDTHAAANTTSVYTAAGVFPMLPPLLSNDRTSLHEGEERLAVVVDMKVDREGSVTDAHLYRAAVRNHAKLHYDSVAAWLELQAPPPPAIARDAALQAQPVFDRFLTARRAAEPSGFEDLSLAVVKLLGSGAYAAAPPDAPPAGHFGLAVNDYAHSTAPNRRFVDLVTQRLLKATLAQQAMPYSMAELDAIAQHCTIQEDKASTVERRVLKAAAAYLLHDRIGERFDAIVTGVTPKGTFVRITAPMVEGRMVRGFEGLDVGDAVRVKLRAVDIEQRFIDFESA